MDSTSYSLASIWWCIPDRNHQDVCHLCQMLLTQCGFSCWPVSISEGSRGSGIPYDVWRRQTSPKKKTETCPFNSSQYISCCFLVGAATTAANYLSYSILLFLLENTLLVCVSRGEANSVTSAPDSYLWARCPRPYDRQTVAQFPTICNNHKIGAWFSTA